MTYKYLVSVTEKHDVYSFGSNSRNARKHLMENEADIIRVYKQSSGEVVCSACRLMDCILVGTPPKK